MKNLASLLALAAGLLLSGCSKPDRDYSHYGHNWRQEPGLEKEVLKEDSITGDGVTVTPVRFKDTRLIRDEKEKDLVLVKAKGFQVFYFVIENPTRRGMSVEFVVRQRQTKMSESGESKKEETDVKTAQGMYPSSKVSFDDDDCADNGLSYEYVKLLSVKRRR